MEQFKISDAVEILERLERSFKKDSNSKCLLLLLKGPPFLVKWVLTEW
jgi:hypothetical protein